ncbi:MAG: RNA methyltransferase [Erysipelotrichaceae bacterium]|nr:RNA methyltransferase [Erysipelotrichaceae bacterium]MBR3168753.1 RNA methyltransferase [Erysipelotrichaceae bacterium]
MLTSLSNKRVKEWAKLRQKKYRSEEVLYQGKALDAALKEGLIDTLLYTGVLPLPFDGAEEVSPEVMEKVSGHSDIQMLGIGHKLAEKEAGGRRVLLLDSLQDPLNIGTIARTAVLFGFDSVVLSMECADLYHEKALEAAGDSYFRLAVSHRELTGEIARLKDLGYAVYATGLSTNTVPLPEIEAEEKMAFVLGNEGSGVTKEVMDAADRTVKIPMQNIDSLNVAIAATLVMYHFQ